MTTAMVPFTGRVRELGLARDAMRRGDVVAISGDAGIGKTRIGRELVADASGRVAGWGVCAEDDWAGPYAPWIEALSALAVPLPPELRTAGAALSADESSLQLHEAFATTLRSRPDAIVILDDMQWADRDSVALLRHVARTASVPLIVIYRSDELALDHPLAVALAALSREDRCTRVAIGPLTDDDAREVAEAMGAGELSRDSIDGVVSLAGGNAFFLTEIVQHVLEEGGDPTDASENVRVTVAQRFSRLAPNTQTVLSLASAFTRPFTLPVLQILTELDEDVLGTAIDETVERRMLREIRPALFDFTHALVRSALYDLLSPSRRARVHRRIALAIEQVHGDGRMSHAAELASQYTRSVSLPGADRGVVYAIEAAAQASAASAPAQAAEFLKRALELAGEDQTSRAMILRRRAGVLAEALDVDDSVATALEAAAAAANTNDALELVADVVSILADGGVEPNRMQPLIARGLAIAEPGTVPWALLRIAEPRTERRTAGDVTVVERLPLDPDAVRILRDSGVERHYARTIATFQPSTRDELDALLAAARRWSDPAAKIRTLICLSSSLGVWCGAIREAGDVAQELYDIALREHSIVGAAWGLATLAEAQCALGDFDRARETRARLRSLAGRAADNPRLQANAQNVSEILDGFVGADWSARVEEYRAAFDRDRRAIGHTFGDAALLIRAYGEMRDRESVEPLIEMITPLLEERGALAMHQGPHVCYVCDAIWSLRLKDWAARYRALASDLVAAGAGECSGHSHELSAGRMAALMGDVDAAREWFDHARATLDRSGQRPLRAIVDFEDALLHDDAQDAARMLDGALEQFRAIGMAVWVDRATKEIGVRRGRRDEHGLSSRERDIIRRIAQGHTNREIAEELVLSVRTVERHVLNLYTKLGIHRRADAAAYAVRHDL